jgi:hypothetical protein
VYVILLWSKREEGTGGWRKFIKRSFHKSYSSPNIIRMIKLRRIRWVGHVARMGEKLNAYRVLV